MTSNAITLASVGCFGSPWVASPVIAAMHFRTHFYENLGVNDSVSNHMGQLLAHVAVHYPKDHPVNYQAVSMLLTQLASTIDKFPLSNNNQLLLAFFPTNPSTAPNSTAIKRMERFQLQLRLVDALLSAFVPHIRRSLNNLPEGALPVPPLCPTGGSDIYPRAEWIIGKIAGMNENIKTLFGQMVRVFSPLPHCELDTQLPDSLI